MAQEPEFISIPGSLLFGCPMYLEPNLENWLITSSIGKNPFFANTAYKASTDSFTHNKTITVRIIHILWTDIHLFKIKCYQCVHYAHVTADMAALAFYDHVNDIFSQVI